MSENRYHTLFENSENAIFITSSTGQLTDVNPAYLRLFGHTKDEALKLNIWEFFVTAEDVELFRQEMKANDKVLDFEAKLLTHDKTVIDGLISSKARRATDDQVAGYQGIIRDISARKEKERLLRESNETLEKKVQERTAQLEAQIKQLAAVNFITQMVASAHDTRTALEIVAREMVHLLDARSSGIALLNEDRTELTVEVEYSRDADGSGSVGMVLPLAGNVSSREVVETGQSIVVTEAQTSPLTESIHHVLRERQTQALMILPLLARGQVIGTIGIDTDEVDRTFSDDEVMVAEMVAAQIAGTIQNVRSFDQDLQQAYARLQELDHLKSAFIGVITHELRSPFVAADLSVQLLNRYYERGMFDEVKDQISRLDQELIEGRRMIDSIISFAALMSKQGGLFLEKTDLVILTEDATSHLTQMVEARKIGLTFDFSPELPAVYLDQQRISEAIHHLIHNAIKFNREGGSVKASWWVSEGKVFFKVQDSGAGIASEKLNTIWEAFSQTADDVQRGIEGLGLGLALVKSAVDAHGGEVSAISELDQGSTFGFWIPQNPRQKKSDRLRTQEMVWE